MYLHMSVKVNAHECQSERRSS